MNSKTKTNICITCVGGKFIHDFVECLRTIDNIRIIGIDADPYAVGQMICDEFYVAPMAIDNSEAYLKCITDITVKHDIDIFIPSSDEEVTLAANNFDYLTKDLGLKLSFSCPEKVEHVTDKYNLLTCLAENELYDHNFYLIENEDMLDDALKKLGYPNKKIIAKPRFGRGSRGVFLFDSSVDKFSPFLEHRFCGTGSKNIFLEEMNLRNMPIKGLVVMPYHDGNFYDIDMVAKNGEIKDICIRLRQLKNQFSPTSTGHKICMKQNIIEYAEKVCRAIKADGVFDIDVIETKDTIVAIDAAFRFSGSVGASRVAGHNMPSQLIKSLLGEDIKRIPVKDNTILRPFWTMQSIKEDKENIAL